MGKVIVIEGLDGSGKATQARLLYEYLISIAKKAHKVSFPDYESNSSALVKMYLNGEFGEDPNSVNAYAASSFYAVDRYASYKKNWEDKLNEGAIIVADRYTTSNMIHQCSKLPKEKWNSFNTWLMDYEYKLLGIPEPSMVVYLCNEVSIGQELMNTRYAGDESKKDIHEKDIEYLGKCKMAADYCADKLGWVTIECLDVDRNLRSVQDIHNEIVRLVGGVLV